MSVIVSGGRQRQAGSLRNSWPYPSGPIWTWMAPQVRGVELLRAKRWATFEQIVRSQPWVFAAVTRMCWWCARVPLGVYTGPLDDPEPVTEGSLVDLVRRPNKRMGWGRYMRDQMVWDYMTHANALGVKYRTSPGAPPSEIWPVPWKFVTEIWDEADRPIGYQLWLGGETFSLTPDEVWHSRWPRGVAPLEALSRTVGIEDAALTYQTETLRNGMTPRAAFTMEHVQNWSPQDKDLERLRKELDKLYAGPDNAGRYAILHDGLKYDKPIGVSAVDLALIEQRKLTREETAAAFDISPPFLGMLERSTFNNISELRDMNFRDSVGPKIEALQGDFQDQVVVGEPAWDGLRVMAQMGAILQPSPEAAARQDLMDQQNSTTAIDERRARRGLRPYRIKGVTDVPLIPQNMLPAGAPRPASTAAVSGNGSANLLHDELVAAVLAAADGDGHGHPEEEDDEE